MQLLLDNPPDWEHLAHDRKRCWIDAGELDITFETTWTTEPFSEVPLFHGGGEVSGEIRGEATTTGADAQMGQADDDPGLQLIAPLPGGAGFFVISASPTSYLLERDGAHSA